MRARSAPVSRSAASTSAIGGHSAIAGASRSLRPSRAIAEARPVRQRPAVDAVPGGEHRAGGERHARIDQQHRRAGQIVLDRLQLGPGAAPDAGHALDAGRHVGAEPRRPLAPVLGQAVRLAHQPEHRPGIGRAAAEPRRDRQVLLQRDRQPVRRAAARTAPWRRYCQTDQSVDRQTRQRPATRPAAPSAPSAGRRHRRRRTASRVS